MFKCIRNVTGRLIERRVAKRVRNADLNESCNKCVKDLSVFEILLTFHNRGAYKEAYTA